MATFEFSDGADVGFHLDGRLFLFSAITGVSPGVLSGVNFFGDPLSYEGSFAEGDGGPVINGITSANAVGQVKVTFGPRIESQEAGPIIELVAQVQGSGDDRVFGNELNNLIIGENISDGNRLGRFGDDELFGRGGNDTFFPGPGNDLVDGQSGFDFLGQDPTIQQGFLANLSISAFTLSDIQVGAIDAILQSGLIREKYPRFQEKTSLEASTNYDAFGGEDSLRSVEGVFGSSMSDIIVAHGTSTEAFEGLQPGGVAFGNDGHDVLIGSVGAALLSGGNGEDLLVGGAGSDFLNGDEDNDVLYSWNPESRTASNKDVLDGGGGQDTYFVDGFPASALGAEQSTDLVRNWEIGEKIIWLGEASPELRSTAFVNGEQHLLLRDEKGDLLGGFSWGNGLGTSPNRKINGVKVLADGVPAIEFTVVDEKPTAIEELQRFALENRTALCTGKTIIEGLKAIIELRAQVGKIASKSLARTLDPEDLGEDGFGKFARGWWPDADTDAAAAAIEERTTGIIDTYLGLLEEKIVEEIEKRIKQATTVEGLTKEGIQQVIDSLAKEYCPPLPEQSWFATAGELLLSPLPIASAVLTLGKAVINSSLTYATAEIDRVQREELEKLDAGIEIIFSNEETKILEAPEDNNEGEVKPTEAQDAIILSAADVNIVGVAQNFDGDRILNFGVGDTITITDARFSRENITVTRGSAILDIDTDNNGSKDTRITLEGDFDGGDFETRNEEGATVIAFVEATGPIPGPKPPNTEPPDLENALIGTALDDTIRGAGENDSVNGLAGDDLLIGGAGNDSIKGAAGDDRLRGNRGEDTLKGGGGDDNIKGNGGEDVIRGNGGQDVIRAGGGADNIKGGGGNDLIFGGGGADRLNGGGGADTIRGNGGDDIVKGNGGADTFQFRGNDGSNTINGFQQGQDLIEIISGANSFGGLDISQDGRNVLIEFANTDITVTSARTGQFSEDDFIF